MMRDPEKTIGALMDKAGNAFLSYLDDEGFPVTKAMLRPRERQGLRTIWFSTNTSSNKVAALRKNPQASVYYLDKRFFRGVSLCGTIEVLEDAASKERLWQPGDTMYYPQGVSDPDYCVLRLTVTKGRYYSNFSSQDFAVTAEMNGEDER